MKDYFDKRGNVFIKLYKKIEDEVHYWETWNNSKSKAIIHWGTLGDFGKHTEVVTKNRNDLKAKINDEINAAMQRGFQEISIDNHYTLAITFKLDSWGSPKDLNRREELRSIITEELGWTGNGRCDDGDIGSGEMTLYADVVNPYIAVESLSIEFAIKKIKDEHRFTIMFGGEIIEEDYKFEL